MKKHTPQYTQQTKTYTHIIEISLCPVLSSINMWRPAVLTIIIQWCAPALGSSPIGYVFQRNETDLCGYEHGIRIPQMTVTPTGILLVGQCRNAVSGLGDDMSNAKIVSKFSPDMGKTWGPMKILSPRKGYSHGQVVYDRIRKRVLFQYQFHPSVNPEFNNTFFQSISNDDGHTWSDARDITSLVKKCNPDAPNHMQVMTAGAKIQTSTGRIIFAGHGNEGLGCRWWTDDGGETYHTSNLYRANEASLAEVAPNWIYMNGRHQEPWTPHRTSWTSHSDGTNFTSPYKCPLLEDNGSGCSAGLVALHSTDAKINKLFFSEPQGPGRIGLRVHCSLDGGSTWPYSKLIGGKKDKAAYSSIVVVASGSEESDNRRLLVVWEALDSGGKQNWKYTLLKTNWCNSTLE